MVQWKGAKIKNHISDSAWHINQVVPTKVKFAFKSNHKEAPQANDSEFTSTCHANELIYAAAAESVDTKYICQTELI